MRPVNGNSLSDNGMNVMFRRLGVTNDSFTNSKSEVIGLTTRENDQIYKN